MWSLWNKDIYAILSSRGPNREEYQSAIIRMEKNKDKLQIRNGQNDIMTAPVHFSWIEKGFT